MDDGFVVILDYHQNTTAPQFEEGKLKVLSGVLPLVLARDVKETEPPL